MKRIFSLMLATLLLLTACAVPSEDAANTTTAVTTTVTTAQPETIYRPDLAWIKDEMIIDLCAAPVNHRYAPSITKEKPIPCTISLGIYLPYDPEDPDAEWELQQQLEPIEYFSSIGWEILPQDAWEYVQNRSNAATIFVAPTESDFLNVDLRAILEFYNIDPAVIDENRVSMGLSQCILKTTES